MIYAHIFVGKHNNCNDYAAILGTAISNLIAWVTRCPGFVHPALTFHLTPKLLLPYCGNLLFRFI
jgi:hypothetical protein